MPAVATRKGLLKLYSSKPQGVQDYFDHLPSLVNGYPLDVSLAYVFALVELAQNRTLYCGIVKLHRTDATVTRSVVDTHYMTRKDFKDKFDAVFGRPMPDRIARKLRAAEKVRDRVMHGKSVRDADLRSALANVIEFADDFNGFVSGLASFRPFGDLRGFKGAAKSLGTSTTRWVLRGMGFVV